MKPMNVIGVLKEGEQEDKKCVLCGKVYRGWGNDAWPLADGYCCDKCNNEKVIPARIAQMYGTKNESNLNEEDNGKEYRRKEFNKLSGGNYKLKITSNDGETNWLDITDEELAEIEKLLTI